MIAVSVVHDLMIRAVEWALLATAILILGLAVRAEIRDARRRDPGEELGALRRIHERGDR